MAFKIMFNRCKKAVQLVVDSALRLLLRSPSRQRPHQNRLLAVPLYEYSLPDYSTDAAMEKLLRAPGRSKRVALAVAEWQVTRAPLNLIVTRHKSRLSCR